MPTKQDVWLSVISAAIRNGRFYTEAREYADSAASDFESEFPQNDSIILPIADSEGFELPFWVKAGAYCIDSRGHKRQIYFVGLDKDGIWNCRFDAFDCSLASDDYEYVKFISPLLHT